MICNWLGNSECWLEKSGIWMMAKGARGAAVAIDQISQLQFIVVGAIDCM